MSRKEFHGAWLAGCNYHRQSEPHVLKKQFPLQELTSIIQQFRYRRSRYLTFRLTDFSYVFCKGTLVRLLYFQKTKYTLATTCNTVARKNRSREPNIYYPISLATTEEERDRTWNRKKNTQQLKKSQVRKREVKVKVKVKCISMLK